MKKLKKFITSLTVIYGLFGLGYLYALYENLLIPSDIVLLFNEKNTFVTVVINIFIFVIAYRIVTPTNGRSKLNSGDSGEHFFDGSDGDDG